MPEKKRIAVLISGRGSNMLSIAEACRNGTINAEIVLVISNKKKAAGLQKAAEMGIETAYISHRKFDTREDFDTAIVRLLREKRIELVCLAGFMRLLSPVLIRGFPNKIMNIHPSLLPSFPGLDAQWQASDYGVKISGATVHFVDEELDHGPIIIQKAVEVRDDDDGETLAHRILNVEHTIYPEAVRLFCEDRLSIKNRTVIISGKK